MKGGNLLFFFWKNSVSVLSGEVVNHPEMVKRAHELIQTDKKAGLEFLR